MCEFFLSLKKKKGGVSMKRRNLIECFITQQTYLGIWFGSSIGWGRRKEWQEPTLDDGVKTRQCKNTSNGGGADNQRFFEPLALWHMFRTTCCHTGFSNDLFDDPMAMECHWNGSSPCHDQMVPNDAL